MNVSERMQIERPELGIRDGDRLLSADRSGRVIALNVVLTGICLVLAYAAFTGIDGWAHIVVLASIVWTTIGLMIAVSPNRRG